MYKVNVWSFFGKKEDWKAIVRMRFLSRGRAIAVVGINWKAI